jgi:hypothetical protein
MQTCGDKNQIRKENGPRGGEKAAGKSVEDGPKLQEDKVEREAHRLRANGAGVTATLKSASGR